MNLTDGEIAEIHPDYIVLEEFHRAGAEEWGKGVRKLLKRYNICPILGLSAEKRENLLAIGLTFEKTDA